ncbi:MAG: transcription factor S [Candidatus Aenigmatarchaeota archaeon]
MEFCEKCGGLTMPKKFEGKIVLVCRSCGSRKDTQENDFKMSNKRENVKSKVLVLDKKSNLVTLPKTNTFCPKCSNTEAFWWMIQMRAADEPPTRFLRCTKCEHVWREYA